MIFNWYNIINLDDFIETGLVSRELDLILDGVGRSNIRVVHGNLYSIVYDGIMLSIGVTDDNPFIFEGHAVYLDSNRDVWLGIEVP